MNQLAVSLARIADGIGTLLNSPIIIAAVALTGVVLTARSSRNVAFAQNLHERLSTYYADVFSSYTIIFNGVHENEQVVLMSFIAACEKTMMLCSEESREILLSLITEIIPANRNLKQCGTLLGKLRDTSREDLNNIIPRKESSLFHRLWVKFKKNCQNQDHAKKK